MSAKTKSSLKVSIDDDYNRNVLAYRKTGYMINRTHVANIDFREGQTRDGQVGLTLKNY